MNKVIRYLSHPQVLIDPKREIHLWSLSDAGKARVELLADSKGLRGTTRVISSAETKAIETAKPLAISLGCQLEIFPQMHENDRSTTGFLPPEEFEIVADQFFAFPDKSIRGWETAINAQKRIMGEVENCLCTKTQGDVLIVGHGGVGTLLYCGLSGIPISRDHDQGPGGGGCFFTFSDNERKPFSGWKPMEYLTQLSKN